MVSVYFTEELEFRRYYFDEFDNKIEIESERKLVNGRLDPLEHTAITNKGNDIVISNKFVCEKDVDILIGDEVNYLEKLFVVKQIKHGLGIGGEEYKEIILGRIIFDYYA